MALRHLPRDIVRLVRYGYERRGRLDRDRPDKAPPLAAEHVAGAKVFATRSDLIASLPKGGVCTEVGVLRGDFSAYILATAKPDKLHLIDNNFRRFNALERFRGNSAVECHEGHSQKVLGEFPDAYFDWAYIDAGHRYE